MLSGYRDFGAAVVALFVVLSVITLGFVGGAAAAKTVSVPASSPGVNVDAETQSVGSSANVSVGYNYTGVVSASDLRFVLRNASETLDSNSSVTSAEGTLNLTVDPRLGGDERVSVYVLNTSSRSSVGSNRTILRTDSPVEIDDYRVSNTNPAAGESITVNATLNNTGGSSEEFRLNAYKRDGTVSDANNTTVTLAGGQKKYEELTVTYGGQGTFNLTVNGESSTEITVGSGGGGGGGSWTTVTGGNGTVALGSSGTVPVTYDLRDSVDASNASLLLKNRTGSVVDRNDSLVDNDTVSMSVPTQDRGGRFRYTVEVRNTTADTRLASGIANLSVVGNVSVESVTPPANAVASVATNVTVTLNNTGSADEGYTINVYDDATEAYTAGQKGVTVPAGTETTYNVSTTYAEGTRTTYLGNESYGTTTVASVATVASFRHVSGPQNTTALSSDVRAGNMVTVELRNGTGQWADQDLNGSGVESTSVYETVVHLNHSFEPGLVIANGQNVSWSIRNASDHYVVTITAQPLESQFMSGAPSIDNWDSLSDAQDQADDKLLWYSVSFVDQGALYNDNMTNMTISTDAQTFGAPRYDQANDSITIDLAGPHRTVNGQQNDGIYQATIPSAMLSQWGVRSASELTGEYEGESRSITTTENQDGSLDISMDIHYSSGTVAIKPDTSSGSSGGNSGSSSSSGDDDDDATAGTGPSVVEATTDADGTASAIISAVSGTESVRVTFDDGSGPADSTQGPAGAQITELGLNLAGSEGPVSVTAASHGAVPDGTPPLRLGTGGSSAGGASETAATDGGAESDALGYFSIDVTQDGAEPVRSATVAFSVDESTLEERAVAPEDVRLYRYHDGEWQELATTYRGDGTFVAETPGFSVFAIGSTADERQQPDVTDTATSAPETTSAAATQTASRTPATTTQSDAPGFGILLALSAFAVVAAGLSRRRR